MQTFYIKLNEFYWNDLNKYNQFKILIFFIATYSLWWKALNRPQFFFNENKKSLIKIRKKEKVNNVSIIWWLLTNAVYILI